MSPPNAPNDARNTCNSNSMQVAFKIVPGHNIKLVVPTAQSRLTVPTVLHRLITSTALIHTITHYP